MEKDSNTGVKSYDIARRIAQEGMVLLENNGVLPLNKDSNVAVFGIGQLDYLKVGAGSGSINSEYSVNLIAGLRNNGKIRIDEDLATTYEKYYQQIENSETTSKAHPVLHIPASVPEMPLDDTTVHQASIKSDVAIVTFNRNSGEGRDRTLTRGDYYLSEAEEDMFSTVRKHFSKIVAVLNICGVMDMSWIDKYRIDAVLLAWLPGMEGGNAMADILTGDVNPSGKLTDTFALDYWDYPSSYNFGSFVDGYETIVADGSEIEWWGMNPVYKSHPSGTKYTRPINNHYFVKYAEGIYVGYRYFETFGIAVRYPFGYGLSYTTFEISVDPVVIRENKIFIMVTIKNTGNRPGKEVIQVYFSAPDGKLEKPVKSLISYAKTNLIQPGDVCTLTTSFEINHMASYDEESAAYILEPGNYNVFVGNSIKNVNKAGTYLVDSTIVTQQLTNQVGLADDIEFKTLSKFDHKGTFPTTPAIRKEVTTPQFDSLPAFGTSGEEKESKKAAVQLIDVYQGKADMANFISQMTDWEMINLLVGTGMGSTRSMFGDLSSQIPGAAGHTAYLDHLGIPTIVLADGPAGIRINKPCTAFPVATLVACTWNEALAEEMGLSIGQDAIATGVDFWLAPALNIHRNPLCGRNFEYCSEDPVISGTIAAAIVRGVQSCGIGATCKHFVANNQETERHGVDTIVNERTLREIYLKGFEIAVKSSHPWAIMTSYNAVNSTLTAARKDLNIDILRKEWGFEGIVMTDWEGEGVQSVEALKSRHNLLMPGYQKQINHLYQKTLDRAISRSEIEQCTTDLLEIIMKTRSFAKYYGIENNDNDT